MKKDIDEAKLRRDLRLALYSCLLYLGGMTAGFFVPWLGLLSYAGIPASYAINELIRRTSDGKAR